MKNKSQSDFLSPFDRMFSYLDKRKVSDRFLLYAFSLVGIIALGALILSYNEENLVTTPESGGILSEGIIGTPRFVNPVLAITRADNDLTALIYSGLMTIDMNGQLVNNLADSITISDDGLTYNVILKENIYFHDGQPVKTEDVAYTINLIQNPDLKSPLRGNWNSVVVEEISDKEFNLVLDTAYAPFIENFIVGILPKHVWGQLDIEEIPFSQTNTEPIGSGPFRLDNVHRDKSGLTDSYLLTSFEQNGERPNIENIKITFYPSEAELLEALNNGVITSTAYLSYENLDKVDGNRYQLISSPLPRVFTLFFNQNKSEVLRDQAVRDALEIMVDRDELVKSVLLGYAKPTISPIPEGFIDIESTSTESLATSSADRQFLAEKILLAGDWAKTEEGIWQKDIDGSIATLELTLATINSDVFSATAEYLEKVWGDLAVKVTVERYESTDLVQAVIRPRDFETLLFGAEVGRSLDLYPFWHSSQREDPGLNISSYTNITADSVLEDIRATNEIEEKNNMLLEFASEIESDKPAVFLYTPLFTYVVDKKVTLEPVLKLAKPNERFSTVSNWYINEDKVWPIFKSEKN